MKKKVCSGCKTLTALVKFFLPISFRFFRKISYLWQTLVWNTCIFSLPVICCDRKFCEKIFLAPSHSTSSLDDRIEGGLVQRGEGAWDGDHHYTLVLTLDRAPTVDNLFSNDVFKQFLTILEFKNWTGKELDSFCFLHFLNNVILIAIWLPYLFGISVFWLDGIFFALLIA